MHIVSAQQRQKIDRQVKVAQLRLSGVTDQRRIADALNVSQSTISRDFAELDARFRTVAAQDIATAKGIDLERIDALIVGIWAKAKAGNLEVIDRVDKLLARRAKLLGLDAPKKVEDVTDYRKAAERVAAELGKPELVGEIERDMVLRHEAMQGLGQ